MKIGLMSQHLLGECLQNTNDTRDTHTVNTNQAKQCRLVLAHVLPRINCSRMLQCS